MPPKRTFNAQAFLDSAGLSRKVVKYPSGAIIFTQGDPCDHVLYIQNGTVKLSVISKSGRPEDGTDPKMINMAELLVDLKPPADWPRGVSKDRLVDQMNAALQEIPRASEAEVDAAVARAVVAQRGWAALPPVARITRPATQNNGSVDNSASLLVNPVRVAVGSTVAIMARWLNITPLGWPVVPDVYRLQAIDSGSRVVPISSERNRRPGMNSRAESDKAH